jgi:hypothetical protein
LCFAEAAFRQSLAKRPPRRALPLELGRRAKSPATRRLTSLQMSSHRPKGVEAPLTNNSWRTIDNPDDRKLIHTKQPEANSSAADCFSGLESQRNRGSGHSLLLGWATILPNNPLRCCIGPAVK